MKSAQPAGRPQKLARRMERAILHNEYQPGEQLPAERALAQRWKASRSTVREALGLLVAKGMLTRRQGDGTYVNDSAQRLNMAVWSDMAQQYPDLQADLLEFRHMLECRTAQLAAARHDAQDRKKLEQAAATVDAAFAGGDVQQRMEADFAFHRAIAEAAHNPLFAYLITSLQALMHDNMRFSLAGLGTSNAHTRAVRGQHEALLKSILKRDPAAAALAATGHLNYVTEQINHIAAARVARP